MRLLERYILEVISLSGGRSISLIVDYLNENREVLTKIIKGGDAIDFDPFDDYVDLDNFVYECGVGLKNLGLGNGRVGYEITGENFVLKVAKSEVGVQSNLDEVDISNARHGKTAQDIFVKMIGYDKLGKEKGRPYWMICEKVVPFALIDDSDILSIGKKVFPTIWNMISDVDDCKKDPFSFRFLLEDVFSIFASSMTAGVDSKEAFYSAVVNCGVECIDFEDVVFYEDFNRFNQAFVYIRSHDMEGLGNLGLDNIESPSPASIKILDFSIDATV
jgi:hypothetical protein